MRSVLSFPLLAVLAVSLTLGCSRQPQPHVGEWDAQTYSATRQIEGNGRFYFSEDGTVQTIEEDSSPPIEYEGKYRFDYSTNPITLDIEWNKGQVVVFPLHAIVQFFGEGKDKMRIVYSTKERPSSFQADEPSIWLTRKVKK
jgi:uncharacterized protein (TIGR03067 family)